MLKVGDKVRLNNWYLEQNLSRGKRFIGTAKRKRFEVVDMPVVSSGEGTNYYDPIAVRRLDTAQHHLERYAESCLVKVTWLDKILRRG